MTNLIAFAGEKFHGKDTAAQPLIKAGYQIARMAGAIKDMAYAYLEHRGVAPDHAKRLIDGDLKETPSGYFSGKSGREFQQALGTMGRHSIDPDIWALSMADFIESNPGSYVTTDIRRHNEADHILRLGGEVYGVFNPRVEKNEFSDHESEREVPELLKTRCKHVFINAGTIGDLHTQIKSYFQL